MKKSEEYRAYIADVIRLLGGEQIEILDFDRLRDQLSEVSLLLEQGERSVVDLEMLRNDYVKRISGLLKAVAVVDRKKDEMRRVLVMAEDLASLPARDLVEQYSRAQAKFRDAFPTSFGMLSDRPTRAARQDYGFYK